MTDQVDDVQLHLTKLDLECQKLALELANMQKPWWKKTGTWALLVPIIGGLVTGVITMVIDYNLKSPKLSEVEQKQVISIGKTTGTSQEAPTANQQDEAKKQEELLKSIKASL